MRTKRGAPEIFSLSFLDVFACVLGALLFIMILAALQAQDMVSTVILNQDQTEEGDRLEEVQKQLEELAKTRKAAIQLEQRGQHTEEEIAALEREFQMYEQAGTRLAELQESFQEIEGDPESYRSNLAGIVANNERRLRQLEEEYQKRKEESSTLEFRIMNPTTAVPQDTVFVIVHFDTMTIFRLGQYIKHVRHGSKEWDSFLNEMRRDRRLVYPMFLVEPDGVLQFLLLQLEMEESNLIWGFEPYTRMWEPLYINANIPLPGS